MALIFTNGTGGGNWADTATWAGGAVPVAPTDTAYVELGDTINEVPVGETCSGNEGTITTNNGTVVASTGYIVTNNGLVSSSSGTITANAGTVTDNATYAGIITTNLVGGVVTSSGGTIGTNLGTVGTNRSVGVINVNSGIVTLNYGTITAHYGTVSTNANIGVIAHSYLGAIVTVNSGTITQNDNNAVTLGGAMTPYEILIYRARPILEDTSTVQTTQTWYDDVLLNFLQDGMQMLGIDAPESLLYDPNALYTLVEPVGMYDPLYFERRYRDALVDYVVSRAFAMDGQDKRDLNRSKEHMAQFFTKAGIPKM